MKKTLDSLRGCEWKVLGGGFVRVVDYMGSDAAIVQAARLSYGTGTRVVQKDEALIRFLMRHRHTTPFEMCEIKLHIRAPMDTWRQWIRHRTANVNEYSTRYSIAIDESARTGARNWRQQSQLNRQGSQGKIASRIGARLTRREKQLLSLSRKVYEERLTAGVAREQARKDLPLSTYTEAFWKIDLHNLLHFLELRMAQDAQFEIREFANIIGNQIVSQWCPVTWRAFQDYRLHSMTLSAREIAVIGFILAGDSQSAVSTAARFGWIARDGNSAKPNRERSEAEAKCQRLGVAPPWIGGD
jgi:thymidylate synthase (FAD)